MNEKLPTILAELRCRFETVYRERLVRLMLFGSQARGRLNQVPTLMC